MVTVVVHALKEPLFWQTLEVVSQVSVAPLVSTSGRVLSAAGSRGPISVQCRPWGWCGPWSGIPFKHAKNAAAKGVTKGCWSRWVRSIGDVLCEENEKRRREAAHGGGLPLRSQPERYGDGTSHPQSREFSGPAYRDYGQVGSTPNNSVCCQWSGAHDSEPQRDLQRPCHRRPHQYVEGAHSLMKRESRVQFSRLPSVKGDSVRYLGMVVWRINTKLQHRKSAKWSLFQQFFLVLDRWHTEELKDWNPAVCMITDQTTLTAVKNNMVRSFRRTM